MSNISYSASSVNPFSSVQPLEEEGWAKGRELRRGHRRGRRPVKSEGFPCLTNLFARIVPQNKEPSIVCYLTLSLKLYSDTRLYRQEPTLPFQRPKQPNAQLFLVAKGYPESYLLTKLQVRILPADDNHYPLHSPYRIELASV
jgi:hypothetical protein